MRMRNYRKRGWRKNRRKKHVVKKGIWVEKCKNREPKGALSRVWFESCPHTPIPEKGADEFWPQMLCLRRSKKIPQVLGHPEKLLLLACSLVRTVESLMKRSCIMWSLRGEMYKCKSEPRAS